MARRSSFLLHRAALGLAGALCIALAACGGGGDATAPNPNPGQHDPAPDPQPQPQPQPQPDPGATLIGTYGLVTINDSKPGQQVLLSNPDGRAIGLYSFDASSQLTLTGLGGYSLAMKLTDGKKGYVIQDEGDFKWTENGTLLALTFESANDGRVYPGMANPEAVAIKYDMDGDGNPDTVLGFTRIGG